MISNNKHVYSWCTRLGNYSTRPAFVPFYIGAPYGLQNGNVPWFMCWFQRYISCLFVCLINFLPHFIPSLLLWESVLHLKDNPNRWNFDRAVSASSLSSMSACDKMMSAQAEKRFPVLPSFRFCQHNDNKTLEKWQRMNAWKNDCWGHWAPFSSCLLSENHGYWLYETSSE